MPVISAPTPRRALVAALALVSATTVGCAVGPPGSTASATPAPPTVPFRDGHPGVDRPVRVTSRDGVLPDGVTVFDEVHPGITQLDPQLLQALRAAASDAAAEGVVFVVNSGWRSTAYQDHLFDDAVAEYGSEAAAARWVATPTTSAHVSGDAVDLGAAARTWLSAHGASYGLCQVYANEPWHYERRPEAPRDGCPALYADAADDPRLQ